MMSRTAILQDVEPFTFEAMFYPEFEIHWDSRSWNIQGRDHCMIVKKDSGKDRVGYCWTQRENAKQGAIDGTTEIDSA